MTFHKYPFISEMSLYIEGLNLFSDAYAQHCSISGSCALP